MVVPKNEQQYIPISKNMKKVRGSTPLREKEKESMLRTAFECVAGLPGVGDNYLSHLRSVVEEAVQSCSLIYGVDEAIQWGSGFSWPTTVFTRDATLAEMAEFDLERMVTMHHLSRRPYRLSVERIQTWVPSTDPDYERIIDLTEGMRVFLSSEFVCNEKPPPQRKLYLQVSNAVNKLLLDSWTDGLVFILPYEIAIFHQYIGLQKLEKNVAVIYLIVLTISMVPV